MLSSYHDRYEYPNQPQGKRDELKREREVSLPEQKQAERFPFVLVLDEVKLFKPLSISLNSLVASSLNSIDCTPSAETVLFVDDFPFA